MISGGSSGIGEACVVKFIDNGYKVFNLDIQDNQELSKLKNYFWLKTDVSVEDNIKNSIAEIFRTASEIDTVIVSAGAHLSASILNTKREQLFDTVNLNLFGAFWLLQQVIPVMIQQNHGSIITIGSDQYNIAKPNSAVYGMTKAALAQLTKSIALDYAGFKIRANCIGAGTVDTPLYRRAINNYSDKSGIELEVIELEENNQQPLGRIGKPDEIADLALFLASDKSAFITGAYIPADGGYTIK